MVLPYEIFEEAFIREYGAPRDRLDSFFAGPFQKCLVGQADLKEVIDPHLSEWGWKGSIDELLEFWFLVQDHIDAKLLEYVEKLRSRGVKCYIATNQEKYRLDYMAEQMGFRLAFDGIFGSANLGYRKPDPNFFAAVVGGLGLAKGEVLFWDDTPANVTAAKTFGIQAEEYVSFEAFEARMGDYGF